MQIYRNLVRPSGKNVIGKVAKYHYKEPKKFTLLGGMGQVVDALACPIPTHEGCQKMTGFTQDAGLQRDARARVKMRRLLRSNRGVTAELAHLGIRELVALVQKTKPEISYGKRIRGAWAAGRKAWVDVTEEYYEGVLEATPPVEQKALGFVAGEPYSATGEGDTLYLCLLECRDKGGGFKWIAKVCTLAEWRSAYQLAIYEELVNPCT